MRTTKASTSDETGGRPGYCRCVKLLGDQSPIPAQNSVGFGNARDIPERFAAKALSDFGQGDPFRVGEAQSRRKLGPQDSVLGGQILIPQQEFLVDGASHVGQEPHPSAIPHAAVYLTVPSMV
jgi:hypothetical protein